MQNKRLIRKAEEVNPSQERELDLDAAQVALEEIQNIINEMHDDYLKLFTGLNSLYKEYPKLYDEIKKIVKFPNERSAQDISDMKQVFDELLSHYQDDEYLASVLNLYRKSK